MRKSLTALSAVIGLIALAASSYAATNTSCDIVPKSEWAQCIFDQAASGGE